MENIPISYFTEGKTHKERIDNYTNKLSSGELPNDLNSDELKVLKYILSSPEGMIMISKAVQVPLHFLLGGDENDPFYWECIEWVKAHGEYKESENY